MTQSVLRISAIALGAAAFVSLSPLSAARADSSAEPAPSPGAAPAPSAAAPAPTPSLTEAPPIGATAVQHPHMRHYAHRYTRRYAWRNGHRYVAYDNNPVAAAADGVVGGVADLGSLAAYPFYCFPNYGACHVHWYR